MITLFLAHHIPLWLAIAIYVPTQLPYSLWQVIWYSLVGLENFFVLPALSGLTTELARHLQVTKVASHCK